jgi:hypothetical protein
VGRAPDPRGGGGLGGRALVREGVVGVEEEEGPGVLVVDVAAGAGSWMTWGEGLGGGVAEVEGSREGKKGASFGLLERGGEIDGGKVWKWGAGCRATSVQKKRIADRGATERLTRGKSRTKM